MRHIRDILKEKSEKDDKKEEKIVFVETDPHEPFPNDTMAALKKEINKKSKDLTIEWKSAVHLLDAVFEELNVPKPQAYLKHRWQQYRELLDYAIRNLYDARGFKASWVKTF